MGYFATGLSYLSDDWHYDCKADPVKAFVLGILLTAFVWGCLSIGEWFPKYIPRLSIMGAILTMEILLTICLQKKYTWLFNDVDYYNLQIYEYIEEYETSQRAAAYEEMPDTVQVSCLYGGGLPYIDLIQFAMRDREIKMITLSDSGAAETLKIPLPKEGFLIVDSDCPYLAEIAESYRKCSESKAFILFQAQ